MSKPVILCVDDDELILNSLSSELKLEFGAEYSIQMAGSGTEALEFIMECMASDIPVPVVISDYLMPEMRGDRLLQELHALLPETRAIMLTGHATLDGVANAINWAGLYRFINKPWDSQDLILTIREATKSYYQEQKIISQHNTLEEMNHSLEKLVVERTLELMETKRLLEEANLQLTKEKEQFRLASITDNLTQLFNRGYFLKRMEEEVLLFERYGSEFCVMLVDIDDFKRINDTFGHGVGDEVLARTGDLFRQVFRETDLVGRYGGEEFLALMRSNSTTDCMVIAERFRSHFEEMIFTVPELKVTVSIGMIHYHGEGIMEIIKKVDSLMYAAKAAGKNQVATQAVPVSIKTAPLKTDCAVLCVDDEKTILDSVRIQLKLAFGGRFRYESAENAEEAWEVIEALERTGIRLLVIVADWLMPGIKGDVFLAEVHRRFPQVINVILSGHITPEALNNARENANLFRCIHKPWKEHELVDAIREGLSLEKE